MPDASGPFLNVIVDTSHHNGDIDLVQAANDGILGVIQKATQGVGYADPTYSTNRDKSRDAALLWGAYHFGTGADGIEQADHFLGVVQPTRETLLVLDFEANPQGPSMTLEQARAFVTRVQQETGRWPGLYSGYYIKQLLGPNRDPVLGNCWFWLARYRKTAVVPATWNGWTLWQYTDGALGPEPHYVAGIGRCDRDKFNGSEIELRAFWKGEVAADQ